MQKIRQYTSALCVAAVTTLGCITGSAQTANWTGAVDTDWNNGGNWDTALAPGIGTNASIGSFTVNYNTPMLATGFESLTNSGVLNINASGFNNNFLFVNASSALVTVNNGGNAAISGNVGLDNTAGISVETGGTLNVSGSLIIGTGPTGDTSGTSDSISRGSVTNNGGTLTATATRVNPNNRNAPNYLIINGGVSDLGDLDVHRQNSSSSSATTMRVNGGVVRTTSFLVNGNSYTYIQQDGGVFTNSGTMTLKMDSTTSRDLRYVQNGGVFVTTDPNVVVFYPNGSSSSIRTYYDVNGGTNMVGGFQLGFDGASIGTARMRNNNNANLYIGSQGINWDGAATVDFQLNGSSILGATANWENTNAPIKLGGGTIQAADPAGNPFNITMNGVLSGTTLTKTGGGTLTLGAANTYSGITTISEGVLALGASGSINASLQVIVDGGATFDASAAGGFTIGSGKALGGSGGVVGDIMAASGSSIIPGSSIGTLTFSNNLTEVDNVFNDFELSSASNDVIEVVGNLSFSGLNTISVTPVGGSLAPNAYTLFHYTGNLTSGDVSNLQLTGAPGYLTNDTTAHTIVLVTSGIRAATNITWVGNSVVNDWDVLNTTNWLANGSLASFVQGDDALFNATGMANPDVNVTGNVNPGSVTVDATGDYTFSGAGSIGGLGGLLKTNSGKLTISMDNSYLGATTIAGGTLSVSSLANAGQNSPIGAGLSDPANLVIDGGVLEFTGTTLSTDHGATMGANGGTINVTNSTTTLTLSGIVTGTGLLTKAGEGSLILSAANSYAGASVSGGLLQINSTASALAGTVVFDGGSLKLNVGSQQIYANPLDVMSTGTLISAGGNNNVVQGAWSGTGTLTLDMAAGGTFTINEDMTTNFTGAIVLTDTSSGTLRFNAGGNSSGPQQCSGSATAAFDLGNSTVTLLNRNGGGSDYGNYYLGALAGGSFTSLKGGGNSTSSTYQIGARNLSTIFAGTIADNSGPVAITKVGTGILTLSGQNTYSGNTIISNGVLALTYNAETFSDGFIDYSPSIKIASGAALDVSGRTDGKLNLGGSQTLQGRGTILGGLDASGTVAPGDGGNTGTLTVTNTINLYGTTWMKLNRANTPNSDRLVSTLAPINYGGTLVITNVGANLQAGDTFTLFSGTALNGGSFGNVITPTSNYYTFDISQLGVNGTISVTTVAPPPSISSVDYSTLSSGSITINAANGFPGGPVAVVTFTNVAAPLNTWTEVNSGNFDGSGNYSAGVTVDPAAPQSYYLLKAW